MNIIWIVSAAAISFGVTALLGKWMVPYLHHINFGQTIREVGPKWHQKKNGTPTMGGFMFMAGIALALLATIPFCGENFAENLMGTRVVGGLLMALGFGMVGFVDDYIKVVKKRNLGLTVLQKLLLQIIVAAAYLLALKMAGTGSITIVPGVGAVDLGTGYWVLSLIGIVGMVNAVNFTDGIDGLNTSVTFVVAIFFMAIAGVMKLTGMSILSAACAGGCLGFLMWNFYPAKVFMGDTGSLFLGGLVCALGFGMNVPVLIPLMGIIYVCEILSVVLQVTYFKATHGKRIFKMTPIHHHFEMCGWSEVKICCVFSLVTIVACIVALLLVMRTYWMPI
ncbi:MAG: phospho-N-acetylmuramoyl-pentapeptide-transferase [Clostridiales bacterium]|jgi:phospho-N-acetylmuramoyl-pentapeptide-transferase|nr:phospho-N-acetylmuramoyl-pentapeptide-transferase [Clostridiales bacterium]MCI2161073.1 phospho-N-acetylmuramoyl-pentapeptide-transferase [Oscillospiraceae bacterium]CAB1239521.1 phospho-N-acetylmuramoyl-pentapeptide undecaprenyl phosphate (C55P) transferase [Ruminococcaceae bacterium BL-4]MCI1961193.1 phospho-N-acetylmuramoyl-pentapeptide-transferase [Clostridiales bacterium]MCI2021634.1 phospho-N-acetylmuramoyl-pentapeptide-transferase [Clostridiales bacterium]